LRVGGGDEPARHLDLRGHRLAVLDPPGGAVTIDLVELIAVDGDVAAGARLPAARERPQHGEDRRGRHQRERKPNGHGVNSPFESDIAVATRPRFRGLCVIGVAHGRYITATGLPQPGMTNENRDMGKRQGRVNFL
jgi:hypothetical protein